VKTKIHSVRQKVVWLLNMSHVIKTKVEKYKQKD